MTAGIVGFAATQQRRHDVGSTPEQRKAIGHFGTPPAIAEFMAGMVADLPEKDIAILDPGAGVGTLTAALCDRIARLKKPRSLSIELWESDVAVIDCLQETLHHCHEILSANGHKLQTTIHPHDFVLSNARSPLSGVSRTREFDLAIMNPPYFKLRKDSQHAKVMPHVVHGQPNIYALFMAIAAELLKPNGVLVAITPRSYFNGPYFRKFRLWFLKQMSPLQIHIFDSRKEAFKSDAVLQENVILCAKKTHDRSRVLLTSSKGTDFRDGFTECRVPYARAIDESSGDAIIRVTTSPLEQSLLEAIDRLPHRLGNFGWEISTGPVVSFRATEHLLQEREDDSSAPLLWLRNVRPFRTRFPPSNGKNPPHIRVSERSAKLLLPAKRYVLLKRFTAKEEQRRLVAGIVEAKDSYSPYIGIENHLNYVHNPRGELTRDETFGLAAIFNSRIVDRYFRAVSGNTQVNAAEIRNLPLPPLQSIVELGKSLRKSNTYDDVELSEAVGRALELPDDLLQSLSESAA